MRIAILQFSILLFLLSITCGCSEQGRQVVGKIVFEKDSKIVSFQSEDEIMITADIYLSHSLDAPLIVLFHQAGWSRGEYIEIAPRLNKLGFNCIAIDQRSGEKVNNIINKTHRKAATANKPTTYLDAYTDMEAALNFAIENYGKGKVIVWGSSYSSSLVIKLASENKNRIDGALSFSPGEYFVKFGKSETYISDFAKTIDIPVFITSAKNEKTNWEKIYNSIPSKNKYYFLPKTNGNHGSRALWSKFDDSEDYWKAVTPFLTKYFLD